VTFADFPAATYKPFPAPIVVVSPSATTSAEPESWQKIPSAVAMVSLPPGARVILTALKSSGLSTTLGSFVAAMTERDARYPIVYNGGQAFNPSRQGTGLKVKNSDSPAMVRHQEARW
jgi:hypothetical protein